MRKLMFLLSVLVLTIILGACGGGEKQPADSREQNQNQIESTPITLKVFSAWAENNMMNDAFWMLQEVVADKSDGLITLEWGGGPEAIPPFELAEALRVGIVDIAWTAHTYNVSQIPVVEGAKLSELTPAEERGSGAADFYTELYWDKLNTKYLGKATPNLGYNFYTNFKVTSLDDFKGKTIRVTPAYAAFADAIGVASVTTDPGEVYSALERNMVVGYGWPAVGITNFGWDEVTEYVVGPSFYQVDVIALVSEKIWNKLSEEQQAILMTSMKEVEQRAYDHFGSLAAKERDALQGRGIEIVELDSVATEEYLRIAQEAGWARVLNNDAENGAKLQKLLKK